VAFFQQVQPAPGLSGALLGAQAKACFRIEFRQHQGLHFVNQAIERCAANPGHRKFNQMVVGLVRQGVSPENLKQPAGCRRSGVLRNDQRVFVSPRNRIA
jgi:hypothetical protein